MRVRVTFDVNTLERGAIGRQVGSVRADRAQVEAWALKLIDSTLDVLVSEADYGTGEDDDE